MLSCREVAKLVCESLDRKLPFWTRVQLRIHLAMCRMCAAFARQVRTLRQRLRELDEPSGPVPDSFGLSPEARERIKRALRQV